VLLILHAASSVYLAYYAALALVVLVALCALLRCPAAPGGYRRVFTAALVAGMVMVPLMLPYAAARDVYVLERDPGEAFMMSARGITYVGAVLDPIRHLRQRFLESGWPEAMVGLGTLALAFVGLWRGGGARLGGRRLTGAYLGVALVMALLSLGPRMQLRPAADGGLPGLHLLLAGVVPGFEALRVPVRATAVAVLMLAVLAGFGVDALLARVRWRAAALWVLGGVLVFEIWHPMLHVVPVRWVSAAPPAWQSWIEQQPGREPIVQLPLGSPAGDARAMVLSTRHWRPLVNGYSGFLPAGYYLRRVLASFPDERSQTLLRGLDVRYVVAAGRTAACTRLEASPQAGMRIAFRAPAACVIELSGAVPAAAEPGVSLPVARLVSSDGEELALDTAGTLVREWSQAVEPTTSGWLRIDLEAPAQVQAVVLRLGRRFGLYLRQYRVETSLDGRTWRTVRDEVVGEAPLVAYQRDPEDLWVRIDVTPTEARHLRLLRTADRGEGAFDLWAGWQAWGLAGIEVLGTP
jgi:hypothetical protein